MNASQAGLEEASPGGLEQKHGSDLMTPLLLDPEQMQWQLMGPSGRIYRPQSETMLAYTQCVPKGAQQVGRGRGRASQRGKGAGEEEA